jgi:glucokinase
MQKTAPSRLLLAGDFGGTKTRVGLFSRTYPSPEYDGLETIISEYLQDYEQVPAASFGVADPIVEGSLHAANLPWAFLEHTLIRFLAIPNVAPILVVRVIRNDNAALLGAAAYAAGLIAER